MMRMLWCVGCLPHSAVNKLTHPTIGYAARLKCWNAEISVFNLRILAADCWRLLSLSPRAELKLELLRWMDLRSGCGRSVSQRACKNCSGGSQSSTIWVVVAHKSYVLIFSFQHYSCYCALHQWLSFYPITTFILK